MKPFLSLWTTAIRVVTALAVLGAPMAPSLAHAESRAAEPGEAKGFAEYRRETLDRLQSRRRFQSEAHEAELSWNAPAEWRPLSSPDGVKPTKGILLVHGLGDSPWSFHDVAEDLAARGFLVRTVLLPGHGTRPQDLLDVRLEEWQQVVREQAAALRRDVGHVYLGGFSTGANLVLEYAYANPDIAGLALFSPAFRASSGLAWLAPIASTVRPWLLDGHRENPLQSSVRYLTVPTNGFAQFYRSSRVAERLLRQGSFNKPVFMAVAQHDSILDTAYLLAAFQHTFRHPASRLIWYGDRPLDLINGRCILVRKDRLPEQRISQFSHMGLLFSPTNPLYGMRGRLRICHNGQSEEETRACESGAPVWFSDWGYRESGKVHARLTYNPYFNWQASIMASVLEGESLEGSRNRSCSGSD